MRASSSSSSRTDLDVACPPVEVEVEVLDLPEVGKLVLDVLFGRLLVDVGDEHDPALDGCVGASEVESEPSTEARGASERVRGRAKEAIKRSESC